MTEITSRSKLPDVAIVLLTTTLRTLFAPHPSVVNARALPRPAGGVSALDDSRGYQPWKTSSAGWGAANALRWAASTLSDDDVLKHLGVILPPTLTLMDDWEPRWRDTGAWVLSSWVGRIDTDELRRRGLDTLLLSSLTHSMGLHSPPLSHVLPTALILVHGLKGDKKANNYGTIVDTALVNGWSYVSSNDRDALAAIANNTVIITQELGTGIVRWIKVNKALFYSADPAVYHSGITGTTSIPPNYRLSATFCCQPSRPLLRLDNNQGEWSYCALAWADARRRLTMLVASQRAGLGQRLSRWAVHHPGMDHY